MIVIMVIVVMMMMIVVLEIVAMMELWCGLQLQWCKQSKAERSRAVQPNFAKL